MTAAAPEDPGFPDADPDVVARQILLRRLADQPRSRAELAESLAKRLVPAEIATRLLDRFTEVGLVDDEAFARAWVQSRMSGKGLARRALALELRRKGINDELAHEVLADVDDEDETAAGRAVVQRKLRSTRGLEPQVRLRRLVGVLARKGYPPGLAMRVAKEELTADG